MNTKTTKQPIVARTGDTERPLIALVARCSGSRRALQRWALRYAGQILLRIGKSTGVDHTAAATVLITLGTARGSGGNTHVGRAIQARPPAPHVSHTSTRHELPTSRQIVAPVPHLTGFESDDD